MLMNIKVSFINPSIFDRTQPFTYLSRFRYTSFFIIGYYNTKELFLFHRLCSPRSLLGVTCSPGKRGNTIWWSCIIYRNQLRRLPLCRRHPENRKRWMNEEGAGNQCLFFYTESCLLSRRLIAQAVFLPCYSSFSRGRKTWFGCISSSVINKCSIFSWCETQIEHFKHDTHWACSPSPLCLPHCIRSSSFHPTWC